MLSAREALRRLNWVAEAQLGLSLHRLARSLKGIPRFVSDWRRFRRSYNGRFELLPCLHDWGEEGGAASGDYFWQDLYVARAVHDAGPEKHVDVGSRVDGFVAHVASFRQIEVLDVRPTSAFVPGIEFKQADLMAGPDLPLGYCDSLSCLHALEHFGLGRYGDPVDPLGHEVGLRNMARLLKPGGRFYLSVPVGVERVEFNGQRVFDPRTIVRLAATNGLTLRSFASVSRAGKFSESDAPERELSALAGERYSLGIFIFTKQ